MKKSACVWGGAVRPSQSPSAVSPHSPGQAQGLGTLRCEAALGQGAY